MQGDIPYYGATGQVGWINNFLTNEHLVLLGEDGAPFLDYTKDKAYIIDGKSWVNNHVHILKSFYGKESNFYLMHYLNIFDYHVRLEDIHFADRSLFKSNLIDEEIIGYQKQKGLMFENNYPLFKVIEGIGENIKSLSEGVHYKNFYGTYLSGPFLIRNPFFTIFIL